jgi:hypothetical protein
VEGADRIHKPGENDGIDVFTGGSETTHVLNTLSGLKWWDAVLQILAVALSRNRPSSDLELDLAVFHFTVETEKHP